MFKKNIETPGRRLWHHPGVFIVNFEYTLQHSVCLVNFEHAFVCCRAMRHKIMFKIKTRQDILNPGEQWKTKVIPVISNWPNFNTSPCFHYCWMKLQSARTSDVMIELEWILLVCIRILFSIKQMNYINYRVIKLIFNVFTLTLVLVLLFLFQSAKYSVYWRWAYKPTYFKVEGKITDHKKTTFSLAWQAAAFLIFMRQ